MSVGLGWGLTFCTSNQLPGDVHGADRNGLESSCWDEEERI